MNYTLDMFHEATLVVIHETESFGGSVHMSSRVKSRDFFASRVCKR